MRRLLPLMAAVAALAAAAASAQADTGGFTHLTQIGRIRAPERGFLLDLPPATQITRDRVQLLENGKRIRSFSLDPIQAVDGRFGVILLIDASSPAEAASE